jgi:hypothetical protein
MTQTLYAHMNLKKKCELLRRWYVDFIIDLGCLVYKTHILHNEDATIKIQSDAIKIKILQE